MRIPPEVKSRMKDFTWLCEDAIRKSVAVESLRQVLLSEGIRILSFSVSLDAEPVEEQKGGKRCG